MAYTPVPKPSATWTGVAKNAQLIVINGFDVSVFDSVSINDAFDETTYALGDPWKKVTKPSATWTPVAR